MGGIFGSPCRRLQESKREAGLQGKGAENGDVDTDSNSPWGSPR